MEQDFNKLLITLYFLSVLNKSPNILPVKSLVLLSGNPQISIGKVYKIAGDSTALMAYYAISII
jgi:hypothetical protein